MKLVVLTVSQSYESWLDEVIENYSKKIGFFYPFEVQTLKGKKTERDFADFKKKADSDLILSKITSDDYVILSDEKGQSLDSIKFSQKLNQSLNSGKKRIVFVIGGAFGVSEDLKARAQMTVRLSEMVFNHHIALAVLLEQIYRGITIQKNLPYHNT